MSEANSQGPASLVVLSGKEQGKRFTIAQTPIILGSSENCEICLEGEGIAARHAVIDRDKEHYVVAAMGSAAVMLNGADVKGEHGTVLKRGDMLVLGAVSLRYVAPGETYTLADGAADLAVDRRPSRVQTMIERGAVIAAVLCFAVLAYYRMAGDREREARSRAATKEEKEKQAQLAELLDLGDGFLRQGVLHVPQCSSPESCADIKQCQNAFECFQKALTLAPGDSYVKGRISEIEALDSAGGTDPRVKPDQRVQELLARGQEAQEAGRLIYPPGNNAREFYQQVIGIDPANERAVRELNEIRAQLAALEQQKQELLQQAALYRSQENYVAPPGQNALDVLKQIFSVDPANAAARDMLLGMAAFSVFSGNRARARADAAEMIKWYRTAQALGVDPGYIGDFQREAVLMQQSKSKVVVLQAAERSGPREEPGRGWLDTAEIKKRVAAMELEHPAADAGSTRVFIDGSKKR